RELVAEEERVKRKAEKKKLKKKKQKDRKKREKLGDELKSKQEAESNTPSLSSTVGAEHPQNSTAEDGEGWPGPSPSPCPAGSAASGEEGEGRGPTAEETEEELDLSCPFLCKARQKAGVRLPAPGREKPARTGSAEPGKKAAEKAPQPEPVPLDLSAVEQSRILTGRGIEAAQGGYYAEAVRVFTRAMRLNPREHRLFGNRSYCYEKLGRYEEALRDAQASLRLQPGWPKGLFRQGKALRGLQRYAEAASLFEELLRQDSDAAVATQLEACRALLRVSPSTGTASSGCHPLSPSLPLAGEWASGSCRDMGTSGGVTVVSPRGQARGTGRAAATSPQALPPTHPARDCYPLWVGNVTPRISEKVLLSSFGRFGEIRFIRMLPAQRCAFVNYRRKAAAEAAYGAMQDAEVEGSRLVLQLKHPSHATPAPRRHP
ncbi:TTC31 protein, partial [Podargus strigoides]|nr:TTC31 protein [Podargus strigoides]